MSETAQKYPLWCVDTGRDDEDRYIGPFKYLADANEAANKNGDGELRRCRRLRVSEMGPMDGDLDMILETLNDNPDPLDGVSAWADWNEPTVEAKPSAEAALTEWADKHLETKIFICEGDE